MSRLFLLTAAHAWNHGLEPAGQNYMDRDLVPVYAAIRARAAATTTTTDN